MSPNGEGDNYTHQDQTHGFRLRPCSSRAPVPGHGNRETGLLFRQPGNRLKLLAWAHLSLEGRSNQDRSVLRGQVPALPLARARRGPPVVSFATSTGRSESHQLRHLLAAVQRSVRSAGLVPGGIRHGGPVYVSEGGEHFLALVGGPAEDRTACPSIRKSGDCWIMFHDRDLLERRQTASFDKRQLDQLSDELRESEGRSTRFCSAIGSSRRGGLFSMQWTSEDDCRARSQPNC